LTRIPKPPTTIKSTGTWLECTFARPHGGRFQDEGRAWLGQVSDPKRTDVLDWHYTGVGFGFRVEQV